MRLTYDMLEKQNSDLRTRLSNTAAKYELKEQELLARNAALVKDAGEMPAQISMLQKYIAKCEQELCRLKEENGMIKKENFKLSAIIERLKHIMNKLRARGNKNSSNSDKPSSIDVFHKPKPVSLREKSGKKPGGQPGHKGWGLKLFENPTKIIRKKVKVCGKCGSHNVENSPDYTARQKADIRLVVDVIEERVYKSKCLDCGHTGNAAFDEGFNNPVQYGENLKSTVALLSEHGCVSVAKTAEIINSMSGGILNISWGTVINFQRELSNNLEDTIDTIKAGLCAGGVMGADESGCRVNGSLSWVQVFCNDRFTLFGLNRKRGEIDTLGILTYFMGILIHDHFISYYNYTQIAHGECNEHILRLIKSLIEIFKHSWLKEMSDLLKSACHEKNELQRAGRKYMPKETITKFSMVYDAILVKGNLEYEAATTGSKKRESYHADERRLLARLAEFKDEHLLFLKNFDVPFSNNLSERDIRVYKGKMKVAGCFRSEEGAVIFARIMSLIKTLKKQNTNIFEGIRAVYSGQVPISSA